MAHNAVIVNSTVLKLTNITIGNNGRYECAGLFGNNNYTFYAVSIVTVIGKYCSEYYTFK